MPGTASTLDIQKMGKDLVHLAKEIHSWAPDCAERMRVHIEQARDEMRANVSQFAVIANLMLAAEEARNVIAQTLAAGGHAGPGAAEVQDLRRLVCDASGQFPKTPLIPEF